MQAYIVKFLNILSSFTSRFSDKAKDRIFVAAAFLLILMSFAEETIFSEVRFFITFPISCLFLGIMILSGLRGTMVQQKFRKWLLALWLLFGALELVSAFINDSNYFSEPLLILVAFPLAYIAWANMGYEKVYSLLTEAMMYSFVFLFIISVLRYPYYSWAQYTSFFSNPNGLAIYLSLVLVCLLYRIFAFDGIAKNIIHILLFLLCVIMLGLTLCRSAILAFFCATFVLCVFIILGGGKARKKLFIFLILLLLALLLFYFIAAPILNTYFNKSFPAFRWNRTAEQENTFSTDAFLTLFQRLSIHGRKIDDYSSGRISVWRACWENINWRGHPDGAEFIADICGVVTTVGTTHNYYLQIANNHGILAGAFAALYVIGSGIVSLVFAFRNKRRLFATFSVVVAAAFFCISMCESISIAFWNPITLYYYLVQGTQLIKTDNEQTRGEVQQ